MAPRSRTILSNAVAGAEIVFIMVPDTPDVEATVERIKPALKKGQIIIDMSTISPQSERGRRPNSTRSASTTSMLQYRAARLARSRAPSR